MNNSTQESLVALLCFSREHGRTVAGMVPIECFEGFYRNIAEQAMSFWVGYSTEPGEGHTLDLIDICIDLNPDDAEVYKRIYGSLVETAAGINPEYVLKQASSFVRTQRMKSGIAAAVPFLQTGDPDQAEATLVSSLKYTDNFFDGGTRIHDVDKLFNFISQKAEAFPTGIKELDALGIGPARKELITFVAPPEAGKTWWLIQLAKMSMLKRLKVLHITLEMSEEQILQRYFQSLFSISKRQANMRRVEFTSNDAGVFIGCEDVDIPIRPAFSDPDLRSKISRTITSWHGRLNFIVKQFPTGALTIRKLIAHLDMLEATERFVPDLLIVDYPQLMHLSTKGEYRHALGGLFMEIRGLAVERNIACAAVAQATRKASDAKIVGKKDVGEDWSIISISDNIITYSQTPAEYSRGLARLSAAKVRNDAGHFNVIISQKYAIGQFCMDSARMNDGVYWNAITPPAADKPATPIRNRL